MGTMPRRAPPGPLQPPLDSLEAPAADHHALIAERVRLLAERSRDAVIGVLIGSILITFVLQRHAATLGVVVWMLVYLGVNGYRIWLSRRLLRADAELTAGVLRQFLGFAVANGLWLAALSLGFFSLLPLESKLAMTVLILLAVAGGAATYASYAPGYAIFVAFAIPPLAIEWALVGGQSAWVIVVTLLVFGLMMTAFSRYLASVFERSVLIRFDREQVVQALQAAQRQSDLERVKAEAASLAKSRFLANASHDLRQPAQALALYTAVLQRSATTPSQVELASRITETSRALGDLLDNLLDLSRLDAGAVTARFQRVELQALVRRLGAEAAQVGLERGIAVNVSGPPIEAWSDPLILERMLRNLLHNALKFTTHGHVDVEVAKSGAEILLKVTDTGCGIAPEFHETVFDEFFQVDNSERDRARGLGLGLSIVSRLARLLGARVEVESSLGRGSTFTLAIPAATSSVDVERHVLRSRPVTSEFLGVPILVIDDDSMVRLSLLALLEDWGAKVDAVATLAEAMALAPGAAWRLCLCDLRLRGAEDGLEAAIALRERMPRLPIVFISGDTAPERIERATKSGHYLMHKPVNPDLLASKLSELLMHPASAT